mmetsp:Transcript_43404/g.104204  ORF Transcript_43404/g.104204 Transcript_43404/m.104204 type:complete len:296 (-) Transcript_43404:25-912(-)
MPQRMRLLANHAPTHHKPVTGHAIGRVCEVGGAHGSGGVDACQRAHLPEPEGAGRCAARQAVTDARHAPERDAGVLQQDVGLQSELELPALHWAEPEPEECERRLLGLFDDQEGARGGARQGWRPRWRVCQEGDVLLRQDGGVHGVKLQGGEHSGGGQEEDDRARQCQRAVLQEVLRSGEGPKGSAAPLLAACGRVQGRAVLGPGRRERRRRHVKAEDGRLLGRGLRAGRDRGHQGRRLPGRLLRHRANQGRGRPRRRIREGVCCVQAGRAIGDGHHVTFGALCLAVGVAKARHH